MRETSTFGVYTNVLIDTKFKIKFVNIYFDQFFTKLTKYSMGHGDVMDPGEVLKLKLPYLKVI